MTASASTPAESASSQRFHVRQPSSGGTSATGSAIATTLKSSGCETAYAEYALPRMP